MNREMTLGSGVLFIDSTLGTVITNLFKSCAVLHQYYMLHFNNSCYCPIPQNRTQ